MAIREYLHPYFARKALANPRGAVGKLTEELRSGNDLPPEALPGGTSEYLAHVREIQGSPLNAELDEKIQKTAAYFVDDLGGETYGGNYGAGAISKTQAMRLYALLRLTNPGKVVETGVCNGQSSAYILEALHQQGSGHLYSIDLPPSDADAYDGPKESGGGAVIPAGESAGWFVPERLRDRWTLIEGDSRNELPKLVDSLGEVDVFIHDSAHVYDVMTFEFETVWDAIPPGGLLFSHDINFTEAFFDFADRAGRDPHYVDKDFGFLVK